jgi:hypothetical protein
MSLLDMTIAAFSSCWLRQGEHLTPIVSAVLHSCMHHTGSTEAAHRLLQSADTIKNKASFYATYATC